MKTLKHLFMLGIFCMISIGANAEVYSGSCGSNAKWSLDTSTGLLSITGSGKMTDYDSSDVPWYDYNSYIYSLSIGDQITSIGDFAFYNCLGLTSVTIPNSVTSIGYAAFDGCSGLTSVKIGNSVTSIEYYAFQRCSGLTSVTIPNSVTEISNHAFDGCSGLTSVKIGNSVTEIAYTAFSGCNNVKELIYAEGTKIVLSTYLTSITSVMIPNSVTSIGRLAFSGCKGLTSVTIPNSVTSIGDAAFDGCSGLPSVTIPESVTEIGSAAFYGCKGLTSVTIPNSVTSIGERAFGGSSGLTSIVVESGNKVYDSRDNCNAIIETASNALISGCKNTTIPNSVTSIGYSAFAYCSGLTSVTIPNSVTTIGNLAFSDCSDLTSVTIGNSVTSIGSQAFWYCSGLTSLTIPNSVTSIGDDAFYNCYRIAKIECYANCQYSTGFSGLSYLKEVIIGDSVTTLYASFSKCKNLTKLTLGKSLQYIRQDVFSGCSSLKEVHSRAVTPPHLYSNVFKNVPLASATLYVPMSAKGAYAEATTWKDFGTIVSDTPDPVMHKIHIEVSDYGKVSYLGNNVTNTSWDGSFEEGESIVLKIIPNDGAKLTKLLVNGMDMTSQVKDNQLTLEGMETDVTVKATFETEMMTLTIATSEGTEKTFDVEYGAQFTFMLSQYADNVEKVVFNDVDVTADVVTEEVAIPLWQLGMYESSDDCSMQKYTTPAITASSRLEVTYKLNHPLGDTNLDGTVNVNDITKTAEIILLRAKAEMEAEFDE